MGSILSSCNQSRRRESKVGLNLTLDAKPPIAQKFYIKHAFYDVGNNPRRVNQKVFGIQDAHSPLENTKFYLSTLLKRYSLMKHP